MKFTQANPGRIFVIRLEDGETIHTEIEGFARSQGIRAAALIALGGADDGSRIVVGPLEDRVLPVNPMEHVLKHAHEVTATGTIFPDGEGNPVLHMHMAFGRNDRTVTGCVRSGVRVWRILEVILFELADARAVRRVEPPTGFQLLQPG